VGAAASSVDNSDYRSFWGEAGTGGGWLDGGAAKRRWRRQSHELVEDRADREVEDVTSRTRGGLQEVKDTMRDRRSDRLHALGREIEEPFKKPKNTEGKPNARQH
jgi:hypothetical protein